MPKQSYGMPTQVEEEQQEWQQLAALLGPWLASQNISKEHLFWALATVRSRTFSGQHPGHCFVAFQQDQGSLAGLWLNFGKLIF